jgi:hypothetical protein
LDDFAPGLGEPRLASEVQVAERILIEAHPATGHQP